MCKYVFTHSAFLVRLVCATTSGHTHIIVHMTAQLSHESKIAGDERYLKERRKYLEGRETRLDENMSILHLKERALKEADW